VRAAPIVNVKDLETTFATAEKSRAAVVRRTTAEIEGLRRKEEIAQAALADAESKYAANSVQVLRAKDRLATASEKVQLAEAKQTVELQRADATIASAKNALDQYAASAAAAEPRVNQMARGLATGVKTVGTAVGQLATGDFRGFAQTAAGVFSGVAQRATSLGSTIRTSVGQAGAAMGRTMATAGRGVGETFRKIASGDVAGAFANMRNTAANAVSGITGAFGRVRSWFGGLRGTGAKSGTDTGKAFSSALDGQFRSGASKAGSTFKAVLGATLAASGITKILGGIKSAITGAFGGGFDRVMNIQQAEIKLETLAKASGLSGKAVADSVKASMGSVSDAVDGTKFAISDAADMASQLGAAGVKSGTDMTRWLSITADAAQFTNRSFSDMQRAIGKVAAEGRVTGETFNEMPIAAAALAKSLGKPQAEVRKLASEGKISAEQFATAMEGMIGGAAKNAGASFLSLRDNIKSAMNASMANFIKPVTDAMMPIMSAGLGLLKGFRDGVAKPMGAALGEFLQPKAEALAGALTKLPEALAGLKGMAGGVLGKLRPIFDGAKAAVDGFVSGFGGIEGLGASFGPILALAAGPLGILKSTLLELAKGIDFGALGSTLGAALKPIAAAAVSLSQTLTGTLLGAVQQLLPVIGDAAHTLLPMLGAAFTQIVPLVGQLYSSLIPLAGQLIGQLVPVFVQLVGQVLPPVVAAIAQLVPVVLQVVGAVVPLVAQLAGALIPVISAVIGAVAPLVTQLVAGLAPIITMIASTVLPPLTEALSAVVGVIQAVVVPILTFLAGVIGGVLSVAIKALLPVVQGVFTAVATVIGVALKAAAVIIKAVLGVIRGGWSGAWNAIKTTASTVWSAIKSAVSAAINAVKATISKAVASIKSGWMAAWSTVKTTLSSAWSAIKSTVSNGISVVVGFVRALPGKAAAAAAALGAKLKAQAVAAFTLLKEAHRTGIRAAVDLVRGLPDKARAALGNLGSTLMSSGRALIDGFISGIKSAFGRARDAVSSGLKSIRDFFPFSPAKKGPFAGKGWVTYAGKSLGSAFTKSIAKSLSAGQSGVVKALTDLNSALTTASEAAIKAEAKRLQAARRKANKAIVSDNEKLAKARDRKLAAADKIKDSKDRAAAKKKIRTWYSDNKKKSLGTLTLDDAMKQAKKNLKGARGQITEAKKIAKAQGQITKTLWDDGKYTGGVKRWEGLNKGVTRLLKGLKANGQLRADASATVAKATLADIAKAQQAVTGALNAAKATLADLTKAHADLKSSVAGSLMGELDLGAVTGTGSGKLTFAGVANQVSGLLAKVKTFAVRLKALGKAGIPPALVREVASLGTEKGTQVADALLSGTKGQIKTLAADWTSLNDYSAKAGKYVADGMYGVGIQAQQGLIKGLQADEAKLKAAAKRMTDTLVKEMKKELGIKSPARKIRDQVGRFVPRGAVVGMDEGLPGVRAAAARMAEAAVPAWRDVTLRVPKVWQPGELAGDYSHAGADRTGKTININVHNEYPIAEKTSVTVDKSLTTAGVMGL
jgi:tape measure domain-containing protein